MEPVKLTGHTGAGFYGGAAPSHKTGCPNSNNPFGHSPDCPCRTPEPVQAPKELHEYFGHDT